MLKNKVTSEIIKILNQHAMFKHKNESKFGKQWLNEEEKKQNWFEPVDSNSVMSRLEELLDVFQQISEVQLHSFELDRDEIEAEINDPDTIAYYESFRKAANIGMHNEWGIYINLYEFFSFNRRIAKISQTSEIDSLLHVWKFIYHHEMNHYEIDLAVLLFEITTGNRYYDLCLTNLPEEGLGNGRGVIESKILNPWKSVIINRYDWGNLQGYNDIKKYLSLKSRKEGFEKVLEIYLGLKPFELPGYTHLLMNPKGAYRSKKIPIIFVNNLLQRSEKLSESLSARFLNSSFTILAITESPKAKKRYEKLCKRDPQMASQYRKKIQQYVTAPDLPGHRIRAFQGAKNLIEARVDGGFRVLLRDKGNGQWEVQDLGPDLYQH